MWARRTIVPVSQGNSSPGSRMRGLDYVSVTSRRSKLPDYCLPAFLRLGYLRPILFAPLSREISTICPGFTRMRYSRRNPASFVCYQTRHDDEERETRGNGTWFISRLVRFRQMYDPWNEGEARYTVAVLRLDRKWARLICDGLTEGTDNCLIFHYGVPFLIELGPLKLKIKNL